MVEAGWLSRLVARQVGRSDLTRFRLNLSSDDNCARVWKSRGEWFNTAFVLQLQTTPTAGVMIWGAFAYDTRSRLIFIHGKLTAQRISSKGEEMGLGSNVLHSRIIPQYSA
ncbi:transposable element Tcb1 transposase [Trichonephila clavipes]|nr:transposable element Tcb1 transposase [Trichonephila clavipes]